MDPAIVKLLEEDEDESMHPGAAVEALQAALNRDMEGDVSISHPADSDSASSESCSQSALQWQTPSEVDCSNLQSRQRSKSVHPKEMEKTQHLPHSHRQQLQPSDASKGFAPLLHLIQPRADCQQEVEGQVPPHLPQMSRVKAPETCSVSGSLHQMGKPSNQGTQSQYIKLQKISEQQASRTEPFSAPVNTVKQISLAELVPVLMCQVDKDRGMQLQALYNKLKKREIAKDAFVRLAKNIAGDNMLMLAAMKLPSQPSCQVSAWQNHPGMPTAASAQVTGASPFPQLPHQSTISPADNARSTPPAVSMQINSGHQSTEKVAQKSGDMEFHSRSCGVSGALLPSPNSRDPSSILLQAPDRPHQQLPIPQPYVTMNRSTSHQEYSGKNITPSGPTLKPQSHGSQIRSITQQLSMREALVAGSSNGNLICGSELEKQNSFNDANRVQGGSLSHFHSNSTPQKNLVPQQASTSDSPFPFMSYVKTGQSSQHTEQQLSSHWSTLQRVASGQTKQINTTPTASNDEASEKQSSRIGLMTPTSRASAAPPSSMPKQLDSSSLLSSQLPSVSSFAWVSARAPSQKPSVWHKKPVEAQGTSAPQPSKKRKVSKAISERLNDVADVSGVNLQEEEDQLFSGSKEDNQVSEESRKVVQEEEERLILQKTPLVNKLAAIMSKCGLKNISTDVERCLSLCVEERMRRLICHLIRLSKQHTQVEKLRHCTMITSNVRQETMAINQKAREEWEQKQAEAEKLQNLNEPEEGQPVDVDKEKDEECAKSVKVNKNDDDKFRATAANVAVRAAVGGDDMLSKWQLMAEQARQKCEGGLMVGSSGSQIGKDANHKLLSMDARIAKDNVLTERRGPVNPITAETIQEFGRVVTPQIQVASTISIKELVAVLERDPHMSKSPLIYELYDKIQ